MGLGINGEDKVYLDLSHKPREFLETRLGGILEMYRTFVGEDPCTAAHDHLPRDALFHGRPLGRLRHRRLRQAECRIFTRRTTRPASPASTPAGECDFAYHGANRLGANSLLSASFSGRVAGDAAVAYVKNIKNGADGVAERDVRRRAAAAGDEERGDHRARERREPPLRCITKPVT